MNHFIARPGGRFRPPPLNLHRYDKRVLRYAPLVYYPMDEPKGTVMRDASGNGHHGAYVGVSLNDAAANTTRPMPYFDGINDYATLPSSIDNIFPANEGAVTLWTKPDDPDDFDYWFTYRDGSFEFYVHRTAITRIDGGGTKTISPSANDVGDTSEYHIAITWSVANNRMRRYKNGALTHTVTGLTSYTVTPPGTFRVIGAATTTPTHVARGWLHDVALFGSELAAADILRLATI